MFHFLEGQSKKGANSVCTFLQSVLMSEITKDTKSICLLSDACPGQNRNKTTCHFLLLAAVINRVDILHLFPVRGHSYCQCDRNFGLYSKKIKRMQSIETQDDYLDIIRGCRTPPFVVREGRVHDFDKIVQPFFKKSEKLEISKAVVIIYRQNGTVEVHKNYNLINGKIFKLVQPNLVDRSLFNDLPLEAAKGVAEVKKKDVLSLLPYIKPVNRSFYTNFFKSVTVTDEVCDEEDESELEY